MFDLTEDGKALNLLLTGNIGVGFAEDSIGLRVQVLLLETPVLGFVASGTDLQVLLVECKPGAYFVGAGTFGCETLAP